MIRFKTLMDWLRGGDVMGRLLRGDLSGKVFVLI